MTIICILPSLFLLYNSNYLQNKIKNNNSPSQINLKQYKLLTINNQKPQKMPFVLILTQIFISHEDSFPLLSLYPNESFVLNNDIYAIAAILQIPTFSGSLDGNFHQIANVQLDLSRAPHMLFGSFDGKIVNLGLDFALFEPVNSSTFFGISGSLSGVLTNLSVKNTFKTSSPATSFYALGGVISAEISGLRAEISMSAGPVQSGCVCAFGEVVVGVVVGSSFTSRYGSDRVFQSDFYAVCVKFNAGISKNVTVDGEFEQIYTNYYVFQSIKNKLEEFRIQLVIDFQDFGSGKIEKVYILYNNSQQFTSLKNVRIDGVFNFQAQTVSYVSFVGASKQFLLRDCYIQYKLDSTGNSNLTFQFMEGSTVQQTVINSTFNVVVSKFLYGYFNIYCEILSQSLISKSIFNLFYSQNLFNKGFISVSGLAVQTNQVILQYCNFNFIIFATVSNNNPTIFSSISFIDVKSTLKLVSTYLTINESSKITGIRFYTGFFSSASNTKFQNCLQFSDFNISSPTQNNAIGNNLTNIVVTNLTIQATYHMQFLGTIYPIGSTVKNSIFTNLVIYANYTFNDYTPSGFSPLINSLENTTIENCYLWINFQSSSTISVPAPWTFLVGTDIANNQIINLIETGIFIGQFFVPNSYQSGLNPLSVVSAIYSTESNKTTYNTKNQKSLNLSDIKSEKFMKKQKLFDEKVWKYETGVNFGLPIHDYVFLTDKFWELDYYSPFESFDTIIVSGRKAKNHFAPKDGPNLCQFDCHGIQIFWDQIPICDKGFTGNGCNLIDCSVDSCKNGGTCLKGKCQCSQGYTGNFCEISHCIGCPGSCYHVIGDIYRCNAYCEVGDNCMQGKCIENICQCNSNVSTAINSSIMCTLNTSCIFNHKCGETGVCINETCICDKDDIIILGECSKKTHEDIGECGEMKLGYYCNSCLQKRQTPLCVDCLSDYKEFNGDCYPSCHDCNGDCIMLPSGIHCFSCQFNYQIPNCTTCITGFREIGDQCYKIVNEDKGICYIKDGATICDKCINNFELPLCENCPDNYLLNVGSCYPKCPSNLCLGKNCYESSKDVYFCDSCKPNAQMPDCQTCKLGYTLKSSSCYQIIQETQGDCWNQDGIVMCTACKNNFVLPLCQQCDSGYVLVDNMCQQICKECQGIKCYQKDPTERICESCNPGYAMPSCLFCNPDYILKDKFCYQIINEDKGECWLNGSITNCSTCFRNYQLPSCNKCLEGYEEISDSCLLPCETNKCHGNKCFYQLDKTIKCQSCDLNFAPPSCESCIPGFLLEAGECYKQTNENRGICYIDGTIKCKSCKDLYLMPTCEKCPPGKIEINNTCQQSCSTCFGINCYENSIGQKTCEACGNQFQLPSCETCIPGYFFVGKTCQKIIPGSNGNCIILFSKTLCYSCNPGFIISPDESSCTLICTAENCIYGTCQPYHTCLCHENFIGSQCDSCVLNFGLVDKLCYQINETDSGKCYFYENGTFCTSCNAGFDLSTDRSYCFPRCCTENCINGHCEKDIGCICNIGYKIHDNCKNYYCELDTVNTCNGLGKCEENVCKCVFPSLFFNQTCFDCNLVINGICNATGVFCDKGWTGQYCDEFNCSLHAGSCITDYFINSCIGPQCKCDYLNQLVGCQCIQFCPYPVLGVNISLYESSNNNQGSVIQMTSGDRISNFCVLGCLGCPYVNGSIQCNNGVRFQQQIINGVIINQCNGCLPNYVGRECNICDKFSVYVNNFCFVQCQSCNGNCYFDQLDQIHCLTCKNNFKLPDCLECEDGYVLVNETCKKICQSCHGQCYLNEKDITCNNCEEGYDIAKACQSCVSGYGAVNNLCLLKCTNCTQGTCFIYQNDIICTSCSNGAELPQCYNCLQNFAYFEDKCQPLIPGTDCVIGHCFSCQDNEVLINNICYPKCNLPFCQNGFCYTNITAQCSSCLPGYQMQLNHSCLEIEYFTGGFCTVDNPPKCTCYPGYIGPKCGQCEFEEFKINQTYCSVNCDLDPTTVCNGICNVTHSEYLVEVQCSSCYTGYQIPSCQTCADGYRLNSVNSCTDCNKGFVDQSGLPSNVQKLLGPGCYKYCDFCDYGNCWLRGAEIVCLSCSIGYDINSNCQKCTSGYQQIGGRCLAVTKDSLGLCGTYSSKVCTQCKDNFSPIQCSQCNPGSIVHDVKCTVPLNNILTNCFMTSPTNFTCGPNSTCLQGWFDGDAQLCKTCNDELESINNTCWKLLPRLNMKYSGRCLYDIVQQETQCESCYPQFYGQYCDQCNKGFVECLNYSCCKIVDNLRDTGICYEQNGKIKCDTCANGYLMEDQLCIKQLVSKLKSWYWLLLFVLPLFLLLAMYFVFTKKQKIRICRYRLKIKVKRSFFYFIKIVVGIIICQIIALCIALQDAYVNDVYLYSASTSVGSLPFALALFLLQPPSLDKFFYHKTSDFFMFLLGAGLDFLFQLIIYLLLPEALNVSQTIFKCFSAPFSMLLFTFILKMKYKFTQLCLLFLAVSLPLYYALNNAFKNVIINPYMLSGETEFQLVLDMVWTLVAIIFQASQILFLQNILGSYTEVQVMTRLGFSIFLVYFIFTLINFKSVMMSVSAQVIPMLISTSLVFIMNILTPLALIFISPLAVTFNMLTSAAWVEIIDALSIESLEIQNFYPTDLFPPVFTCIMFILVFVSLLWYYIISNQNFEKFNIEVNEKKEKKNFTIPYLKMKKQQKQEYYDMTKPNVITDTMLQTKVHKKFAKRTIFQRKKLICIDKDTGEEIKIHPNSSDLPPIPQAVEGQKVVLMRFPQITNMSQEEPETLIM